jgi:hypothetical protein
MSQHGQVFRPIAHGDPALVLAEDHIEQPMHRVLNSPMATYREGERAEIPVQANDVESLFPTRLAGESPLAAHHPNAA